jgi:cytochrome c-type biogenesis protein CcmE
VTTVAAPPEAPRRAPAPRRRARYVVAIGGCVVAIVAIAVLAFVLSDNVVYFRTVSEAVADRENLGTDRFRLAGAVVPGSVEETRRGVRFEVTDGDATVAVDHTGSPPDLFEEDAPVVVEGNWRSKGADAPFVSDRIMIRHGSEYSPPDVDTSGRDGS